MEDKCEKCKHKTRRGWEYPCSICDVAYNGEESKFEPKTNADRIRNMSDEELAEFLHEYSNHTCLYCKDCGVSCKKQNLEWLQKECEV